MTNNNRINHTSFHCAGLEFNLELGAVKNSFGEAQRLSPINLKLLAYLLARHGEVISRTELFDAVWPNQIVSDDVLTRAVSDIRTQLTKLDASTKFIETLPKRGYRWMVEVCPAPELGTNRRNTESHSSEAYNSTVRVSVVLPTSRVSFLKRLFIYLLLAFFLAAAIMWVLTQSITTQAISIAVLPAQADRLLTVPVAKVLDDALLSVLRKNTKVRVLSKSAIASRPQNPFPYFFKEFGAAWVLESRVTSVEGIDNVELSLVDARTGLELRNINFDVGSNAEILVKVAQKLEPDLLTERLPY
jgi:DNA-binding winged helix-turn-helix (wHTH) protein